MAQLDYVRQNKITFSRKKKDTLRRKCNNLSIISLVITIITIIIVLTFASVFYFIISHKYENFILFKCNKLANNKLSVNFEKHWSYIKELENNKLTNMHQPTRTFSKNRLKNTYHLIELAKRHNQMQQQQLIRNIITKQLNPQDGILKQQKKIAYLPNKNLVQTSEYDAITQQLPKQTVHKTEIMKKKIYKKEKKRCWIIQCGSFKNIEHAETVRVRLTFEGFNSHIVSNNNWNRVIIGPTSSKENINDNINRLKVVGYVNCICLISED